jgi:hypothetical protein
MTQPTFIIIGAARAGTTSIYNYLKQHPQVFMSSVKEPNFFAFDREKEVPSRSRGTEDEYSIKDYSAYLDLFQGASPDQAVGEASTRYLTHPLAAGQIRRFLPHVKLIAVLRDPAERAYSSYLHHVRRNSEPRSFQQALEDEQKGGVEGLIYGRNHYVETGFYYRHLDRFLALFERHRVGIYLYEDLERQGAVFMKRIFAYLGVDDDFIPDMSIRHNVSGVPRNRAVNALLDRNRVGPLLKRFLPDALFEAARKYFLNVRTRNLEKPALSVEMRRQLTDRYRDDIIKLQDLMDRDLSAWLR